VANSTKCNFIFTVRYIHSLHVRIFSITYNVHTATHMLFRTLLAAVTYWVDTEDLCCLHNHDDDDDDDKTQILPKESLLSRRLFLFMLCVLQY